MTAEAATGLELAEVCASEKWNPISFSSVPGAEEYFKNSACREYSLSVGEDENELFSLHFIPVRGIFDSTAYDDEKVQRIDWS